MPDAHKNFAASLVATAPSPATSGTSLVVTTGDGVLFPTPPFNATICPAATAPTTANAEIVRVTAVSTDTLTITRTQESTSARTVIVGDQIIAGITAKTLTDVEALSADVQLFIAGGTWTKPAGAKFVNVLCIAGGGGGGSGRRGAAGSQRGGGGGGAGANLTMHSFQAAALSSPVTVTIGAGGAGGAATTADSTDGNVGGTGGTTSFGAYLLAAGGGGGAAAVGTSGGGTGLAAAVQATDLGSNGGAGGSSGSGVAGAAVFTGRACPGGGGGGAITTGNVANTGGAGGKQWTVGSLTGAAGGNATGGNGTGGSSVELVGLSAGGGGSNASGAGGAGGAGGSYGGGGGGGGASVNGSNSGKGGDGGGGCVLVVTYF